MVCHPNAIALYRHLRHSKYLLNMTMQGHPLSHFTNTLKTIEFGCGKKERSNLILGWREKVPLIGPASATDFPEMVSKQFVQIIKVFGSCSTGFGNSNEKSVNVEGVPCGRG